MGSKSIGQGQRKSGKTLSPDLNQWLQRAIEHHNAGRPREAAECCTKILAEQPDNAIALDLLGLDAYLRGETDLAIELLQKAIRINRKIPDFHNHLGLALEAQGRCAEAISSYKRAVALKPDYAEAHNNLGNSLNKEERPLEAIASYQRAIQINPRDAISHFNLGIVLEKVGRLDEAVASYRCSLANDPGKIEVLYSLGCCLQTAGHLEQAVECLSQFTALQPEHSKAQLNLGAALFSLNRLEDAVAKLKLATALQPDDADAHYSLGTAYLGLERLDEAAASFERAIAANPAHVSAHNNLGMVLAGKDALDEASSHYLQALNIEPEHVEANSNLGNLYREQGKVDGAIEYLSRAVRLQPDRAEAHSNLAQALLMVGNLAQGWDEFDWRLQSKYHTDRQRGFPQPWWQGQDLRGKTILVWAEQGVGDEILFANVVPDIIAAAKHCVVECAPRLVSLFARSFPAAEIVARSMPLDPRTLEPDIDLQIPMGSLPRWFRPSLESFPDHHGYLVPDPQRVAYWKRRLDALDDRPKIGICWRSMVRNARRDVHYTELGEWGGVFSVEGVTFVNLQYDDCGAELEAARQQYGVEIHAWEEIDLLNDLDEAAALTAALDVVISAATSVAAMAGAIGKPVLMFALNDYWPGLGSGRQPWFPDMELFLRNWGESWEGTLAAIAQRLREFSSGRAAEIPPRAELVAVSAGGRDLGETVSKAIQVASEYQQKGLFREAEAIYSQILQVQPNNPEVLHQLGVMAHQMGDSPLAVELIGTAISIDPSMPIFHNNLGSVLDALGRMEEAVDCYLKATRIQPDYAEAHYNLGTVQYRLNRKDEAVASLNKAVLIDPELFKAHNNLASALEDLSDFDGAIRHYLRALEIEPEHIAALSNLGNCYRMRGDVVRSIAYHRRALSQEADRAESHWNLAASLLISGNLVQGWQEYEWRWKGNAQWIPPPPTNRNFPQPWWQGEDLKGKIVLVWAEQGIGDEILFANVLPDIIAAAKHCVVECEPRLVSLLARSFPAAEIVARSTPPHPRTLEPDIDLQIPMGSLPRWFRRSIESFPAHHGYLVPDPQRVAYWKRRLDALDDRPKIGICWRSMYRQADRDLHYTELGEWGGIFSVEGVTFVNLQYDDCGAELEVARQQYGVEIHAWEEIDLLNDLDEAAALTAALDAVISSATSVAAMAGALGKPVLMFAMNDYWPALGSGRQPWFPEMKLFLRNWGESWEAVLGLIARDLKGIAAGVSQDCRAGHAAKTSATGHIRALPDLKQRDIPGAIAAGIVHHGAGRLPQAEALYRRVLKAAPEHADALHLLGRLALDRGDAAEAIELIAKALRNNPDPIYFFNLARAHRALHQIDEAIACYRKALSIKPDFAEAHINLGNELKDQGKVEEAIGFYQKALAIKPDFAEAYCNLGDALRSQGDLDPAIACFQKALSFKPDYSEAHNSLGAVLDDRTDVNGAIDHFLKALSIRPDNQAALINLGHVYRKRGEIDKSIASLEHALRLQADRAETHWILAASLLLKGNLAQGWQEYDWRWNQQQAWQFSPPVKRDFPQPWWNGEDPCGKAILVWAEQGVGDNILFANVLPDIIAAAKHCVVECDPRLVSLFARSFPTAEIVARSTPPHPRTLEPDIDLQIPMGSLPRWFRRSIESFPAHHGYLVPDPQRVAYWKRRLDVLDDRPKIGISWRSMYRQAERNLHYTELREWGEIFSVEGVTFVNLQYDECRDELEAARQQYGVKIHAWEEVDLLNDLDEAAALTAALDLVIAPGTSVFEMAGAIGKKTLLFSLHDNWTTHGTDYIPWFPSTKIFVRKYGESWEGILAAIAQSLREFSSGHAAEIQLQAALVATSAGGRDLGETVSKAIRVASEYQQAGRFSEAEAIYSQILQAQPNNPEVLHLLGVMAHQMGDSPLAVELIGTAISIDPKIPSFHNNLGNVLKIQGELDRAVVCYEKALILDANYCEAHNNLGDALRMQGKLAEANRHLERALKLNPKSAEAHNNLGSVMEEQKRYPEATRHYRRAIALNANYAEAHNNLGVVLRRQNDLDNAILSYQRAIAINPLLAEVHHNLGMALKDKSELEKAAIHVKRAIELNPGLIDAYNTLGIILMEQNKLDEAEAWYENAYALDRQSVDLPVNWGVAVRRQGRPEEALPHFRQALAIEPSHANAHWNLAHVLLACGNIGEGWDEYEWRWLWEIGRSAKRDFPQPCWTGEDPSGKTVLVWGEQGVGDEIMFANVLPDIIAAAKHCVVECKPRLVSLFARSFPAAEIVARSTPPHPRTLEPDIDLQTPMGSLPRWFRRSIESFPDHQGYLVPDPQRVAYWKRRLDALDDRPKIGICWRSMYRNAGRDVHFTELADWGKIFSVEGVTFVNLQYDDCGAELEAARQQYGVKIHAWEEIDLLNDLDEAAALTAALDVVISSATSVAAMAGALGKSVLMFAADDYWPGLGSGRQPWFPDMKLFLRNWDEPWNGIIGDIANALISSRN